MADHWTTKIEPAASTAGDGRVMAAVSTAISLKRIADALEILAKPRPTPVSVSLSADDLHALGGR